MSDPVRITNPGAESLGYDSDGHEIMAVDIYVINPPRIDVFHGTPPAWSSFGNKTIWGGNEWVDDSPTRSDVEKRDKEITAYKNTLSAQQKENENKRTEAGKRLSAAIAAREKDENTLKTLRAGNADAADITRQEFRLLQNAATALVALVFSILTGSALGIIGYGLLMAVTGALIDESLVEKANKFWGI